MARKLQHISKEPIQINRMNNMKKKVQKHHPNERGVVLIISILCSFIILMIAIPYMTKLSGHYRITEKSFRQMAAFNLAEAGVDRAIWEINQGNIASWEGDDNLRTMTISSFQASGGSNVGDVVIEVFGLGGDNPIIQSTGQVPHIGTTTLDKTIRVVLEVSEGESLFNYGVFGDEGVDFDSNARIDSYDSSEGFYGGDNVSENGHTATNSTIIGSIYLASNAKIYGDALSGPGSIAPDVIITQGNALISGEKLTLPEEKDLPHIPAPVGLAWRGSYFLGSNDQSTISESGEYSSFLLNSNAEVTIQGNITMYVTGDFSMNSNTEFIIPDGSSLTLYLGGTFEQNSNTKINNLSQDPTRVQIYGTESFESEMVWNSNSDFHGAVYVPEANVEYNSNADFYGSIVSKFIHLDSNAKVHYDLALDSLAPIYNAESNSYKVKSWQEKTQY